MQIKWVNDVYANGRKLCGILTEAALSPDATAFRYAIVGIGINLTTPKGGFPEDLRSIAGTLSSDGCPDRNALLAGVLSELHELYAALPSHDFMAEYRSRSCLIGRRVCVITGNVTAEGDVITIDDEGGLVLRTEDGTLKTFRSGTVRWREALL
jgi:BirA family biotin operon repressor/biotin-[acetyl-CoA-carboxylase] ligase